MNDNEGETWAFWLQVDGNEEALEKLQEMLLEYEPDPEYYHLTDIVIDESEVDTLVKYGNFDSGYWDVHHKVTGKLDLKKVRLPKWSEDGDTCLDDHDTIYKGQIKDHFKKDKK